MNALTTVLYDWPGSSPVISAGWALSPCGSSSAGSSSGPAGRAQNLPRMIENFKEWGFRRRRSSRPFVSGMEFVGGLLLLLGLLTRVVSIPMMIIMLVAIASAKWGDVDSLQTLLGFEEISYFVMFAWLASPAPARSRSTISF